MSTTLTRDLLARYDVAGPRYLLPNGSRWNVGVKTEAILETYRRWGLAESPYQSRSHPLVRASALTAVATLPFASQSTV